jgi:hypothetical protein
VGRGAWARKRACKPPEDWNAESLRRILAGW